MNLLYQTLFPASLLPWVIMCLFYLLHGYISLFLILLVHIATNGVVILHRPIFKLDMQEWSRILHMQRIALWLTYTFRNQWNQHFFSLLVFLSVTLNLKLMKRAEKDITSEIIHTLFALTYCSTAHVIPVFVALCCVVIYYFIMKPVRGWSEQDQIKLYFHLRMGYNYLFAFIEWYSSDMNKLSCVMIIVVSVIFNVIVFSQLPDDLSTEHWYDIKLLPPDYPYPLNVDDAKEQCPTAKKLFKSHEL